MEHAEGAKSSHEAVKYESESKEKGESCSRCVYFIDTDPARCEIVVSPIEAQGWCKRFELDPGQLTHAEYKKWREEGGGKEIDPESEEFEAYRESRAEDEARRFPRS